MATSKTSPKPDGLTAKSAASPWQPDRGDGTYRNPVLCADYSDPDVIRVGEDYWLTSSSFSHVPGLPILHSRDLVNWTLVNHALQRLVPTDHFSVPRAGEGVWAPSLRHHDGKFWIYYPDPDFGLYVITASDPRETWSSPELVLGGKGLIDPCPLWDDDGQVYMIHGWAKSRSGISNQLTLHTLTADGKRTTGQGRVIIDANQLSGWRTLEGPKIYKRNGYYYVFAPAGGVAEGYQAVFRARTVFGPYENKIVLAQGTTPINGPHQGAWVDTPRGDHWFFHFQDRAAFGRVVHMQPLLWGKDDWPLVGNHGEPVLSHPKPKTELISPTGPASSDEFEEKTLGLQWQWQANPRADWYSLKARPGWLRLRAVASSLHENLWTAGHLLLQKFPAPAFSFTTRMDFSEAKAGVDAGLVVFGYDYAWLGIRLGMTEHRIAYAICREAREGHSEQEVLGAVLVEEKSIFLRVTIDSEAFCHFSYSFDNQSFASLGHPFRARESRWVGAKVGLFATTRGPSAEDTTEAYAEFDWVHVSS